MIVNHRLHRSPAHWSTAPARHHYLHRSAYLPKWPHGHRLLSNFGKTVPMCLLQLGGCIITFRGFFSRFHFVKVGKSHTSNMSQSHHKQGREYVEQTRDEFLAAMALKAAKACQVDWIFTTNCNWSFQRGNATQVLHVEGSYDFLFQRMLQICCLVLYLALSVPNKSSLPKWCTARNPFEQFRVVGQEHKGRWLWRWPVPKELLPSKTCFLSSKQRNRMMLQAWLQYLPGRVLTPWITTEMWWTLVLSLSAIPGIETQSWIMLECMIVCNCHMQRDSLLPLCIGLMNYMYMYRSHCNPLSLVLSAWADWNFTDGYSCYAFGCFWCISLSSKNSSSSKSQGSPVHVCPKE